MKVAAFTIKMERNHIKLAFLDELNEKLLFKDEIWHFFLDFEGITLRCNPKFAQSVKEEFKLLKQEGFKFTYKRVKDFNPSKDEYQFVRFVGDEMQHIFHYTSLMALKYPRHVFKYPILERINHIVINQTGQHDFKREAEDYIDAAYGRAALQGRFLGLPKWVHKFVIRRLFTYEKSI